MDNWLLEYNLTLYAALVSDLEPNDIKEAAVPLLRNKLFEMGLSETDLYHAERAYLIVLDNPDMYLCPKYVDFFENLIQDLNENNGELTTEEFPYYYYRLQTLLFYNEEISFKYLKAYENIYNISHVLYEEQDLDGNSLNQGYYQFYYREPRRTLK